MPHPLGGELPGSLQGPLPAWPSVFGAQRVICVPGKTRLLQSVPCAPASPCSARPVSLDTAQTGTAAAEAPGCRRERDCTWNRSVLADSSSVACARDARQSALPLLPFNFGSPPFTECLPPSTPDLKTRLSLQGLASALLAGRPLRSLCESADDPGLYVLSNAISTSLNSSHKAACGAASGSLIWDHLSINLTEDRRPGFWRARRQLPRKKPSRSQSSSDLISPP